MMTETHPRLAYDPARQAWRRLDSGAYVDALPPSRRFRYKALSPFWIGRRKFEAGTVLGEGTVTLAYPHVDLCEFTPADDGYDGPDHVGGGHVFPRLQEGLIVAEPIDD